MWGWWCCWWYVEDTEIVNNQNVLFQFCLRVSFTFWYTHLNLMIIKQNIKVSLDKVSLILLSLYNHSNLIQLLSMIDNIWKRKKHLNNVKNVISTINELQNVKDIHNLLRNHSYCYSNNCRKCRTKQSNFFRFIQA